VFPLLVGSNRSELASRYVPDCLAMGKSVGNKRRNKAQSVKPPVEPAPTDLYHNQLCYPCCSIIEGVAIELKTGGTPFADAIRSRWSRPKKAPNKKKRKKKKKKKANGNLTDDDGGNPTPDDQVDSVAAQQEQPTAEEAKVYSAPGPSVSAVPLTIPETFGPEDERRRTAYHKCVEDFLARLFPPQDDDSKPVDFDAFCSYLQKDDPVFKIKREELDRNISCIECHYCREDARRWLSNNIRIPLFFWDSAANTENSLDYVAMEEGSGVKTGWYFQHRPGSEPLDDWTLGFHRSSPESELKPWDGETLDRFLRHDCLIRGCRINEVFGITDEQQEMLVVATQTLDYEHQNAFLNMTLRLETVTKDFFGDTADHDVAGNIETSAFAVMQATDNTVCEVFKLLLTHHIIPATRQVKLIVDHSPSHAWLVEILENIWTEFACTARVLCDAVCEYEQKEMDLANGQGLFPDMYCSAKRRRLYRSAVQKKHIHIVHTVHKLRTLFDTPVPLLYPLTIGSEWNVTLSTYLFSKQNVYQATGECLTAAEANLDKAIGESFSDVLTWTETLHCANRQQQHELQKARFDKLQSTMSDLQDTLSETFGGKLPKYMSSLLQHISEVHKMSMETVTNALAPGIANCGHCWLRHTSTKVAPAALEHIPFKVCEAFCSKDNECTGGVATTRIHSIFSGLLYQSFAEHYMMWQTYLAEEQLINEMEQDERNRKEREKLELLKKEKEKQKKASRKKSKAGMANGGNPSEVPCNDTTNRDDVKTGKEKVVPGEATKEECVSSETVKGASSMPIDSAIENREQEKPITVDGKATPESMDSRIDISSTQTGREAALVRRLNGQNDSSAGQDSLVGVLDDKGGFISAEAYLFEKFERMVRSM